jgi:hypothetical protein
MRARGYGALDIGFAALYAYLGFVVAPSRAPAFQWALGAVAGLLALAGITLIALGDVSRVAKRMGIVACTTLLVFTASVLVLLVASSAFLFGVYGAIGRGIGILALVAAALVVEVCGLLPFFQLRFHLRAQSHARE